MGVQVLAEAGELSGAGFQAQALAIEDELSGELSGGAAADELREGEGSSEVASGGAEEGRLLSIGAPDEVSSEVSRGDGGRLRLQGEGALGGAAAQGPGAPVRDWATWGWSGPRACVRI